MEPKPRIGRPLSPIALATLVALAAAPDVLPVPWFAGTAEASHCAPAPTCVCVSCDVPPCDCVCITCDGP